MKQTPESLKAIAKRLLGDIQTVIIATYPINIEQSEYDSANRLLKIGTIAKNDFRDEAIIAHEVAHVLQDNSHYWALRLCQWGILPPIFQYVVEKNASKRALDLLWKTCGNGDDPYLPYLEVKDYFDTLLLLYRKKIFVWPGKKQ
jgi:hypothetical protein